MSDEIFDCLVLSGGGGKGSYGAGAAHALFAYYSLKGVNRNICYIGASAGALNACVLASSDSGELKKLWLNSVSNRAVLGARRPWFRFRLVDSWLARTRPFAMLPNRHLRCLIEENVNFDKLADKHIIILTVNFTSGRLEAFYISELLDKFIEKDKREPKKKQRLSHFRKIKDADHLVSVLLASTSIPIFFPPVKMGEDYYVDGGVGNNTPTREAAYFLRFLKETSSGRPGDAYCVQQDPPSIINDSEQEMGFLKTLLRTTEVAGYLHMQPIVDSWNQINTSVAKHEEKVQSVIEWLKATPYDKAVVDKVVGEIQAKLSRLGDATPRLNIPLTIIQPSSPLGETIDFTPKTMKANLKHGYQDMLNVLMNKGRLDEVERKNLSNEPLA